MQGGCENERENSAEQPDRRPLWHQDIGIERLESWASLEGIRPSVKTAEKHSDKVQQNGVRRYVYVGELTGYPLAQPAPAESTGITGQGDCQTVVTLTGRRFGTSFYMREAIIADHLSVRVYRPG